MTTNTTFRSGSTLSHKALIPIALLVLIASIFCAKAGQNMVVKVPFEFQAGDAHFPAGTYTLSMDGAVAGSVMIQSADRSHRGVLLVSKSISAPVVSAPFVSFRGYGETRFLSAIQNQGATARWEIIPSPVEAELARTSEAPALAYYEANASGAGNGSK